VEANNEIFHKRFLASRVSNDNNKPVIHTFISDLRSLSEKDEHVKLWTESWSSAGWDPVILTNQDAGRHRNYRQIISQLKTAKVDRKRWDRYLLYVAMSVRGGGFYSDISILPLHSLSEITFFENQNFQQLPNEGKFTIFHSEMNPELLSGNEKEWQKMVFAMTNKPSNNDNKLIKTLIKLDPKLFLVEDSVLSSLHILKSTNVDVCKTISKSKIATGKYQHRLAKLAGISRPNYYDAVKSSLSSVSNKCSMSKKKQSFTNELRIVDSNNKQESLESNKKQQTASSKNVVDNKRTWEGFYSTEKQKSGSSNKKRPIMHTFFEPAYGKYDKLLLELEEWKKAWYNAGWEPVVISLKDASKHPYFNRFKQAFDKTRFAISDYNRMCFYRWLAMASIGGGWMSDYDTMPLYSNPTESLTLPNNGQFTSFQRHVPALVVGSASEWDRMSKLMYEFYLKHDKEFYSDMFALKDIQEETTSCVFDNLEVISTQEVYEDELRKTSAIVNPFSLGKLCSKLEGKRAMHFSHAGCSAVRFCETNREEVVGKWIGAWNEQCVRRK